jgi:DNA-binding MarR family transcriptional regulator
MGERMHWRVRGQYWWIISITILLMVLILIPSTPAPTNDYDSDSDGMSDVWEEEHGLEANNSTDASEDNDQDGLTNLEEYNNGTNSTDPNDPDTDGGGINDSAEKSYGTDPNDPVDDDQVDSDNDEMPDLWEEEHNFEPESPADAPLDADDDGYTNLEEYKNNTNPLDFDDPWPPKKDDISADGDDEGMMGAGGLNTIGICSLIFIVPGIVILLIIIFVYTKMRRDKLLEHDTRNKIYEYINHNPGTHYRAVMSDLDLHMGTLTHHLNMLETQRYIKSYQDGMYRRFYPIDAKIDTGLILTDVQKKILHAVQGNPGISQTGIAKKLGITRKIVHYHIKLLADAGFVHSETVGRETNLHYLGGLDLDGTATSTTGGRAG